MALLRLILAVLCLSVSHAAAWADVLLMRDGRHIEGRILEETEDRVYIEAVIAGIAAKVWFDKPAIEKILRDDVPDDFFEYETTRADKRPEQGTPSAPQVGGYAAVPAIGVIGEELGSDFFTDALAYAKRSRAEAVIFILDSPGGYASELEKIREALDDDNSGVRCVFYVQEDAMSAAALLCLSHPDFFIGPGGRFGAAVGYTQSSTGQIDVDAKFNSAMAARWAGRMERLGRPGLIVQAMITRSTVLYVDKRTVPWTVSSTKSPEAQQFVSPASILSLTATDAQGFGVVSGIADDAADVALRLSLDAPERIAFDGQRYWDAYASEYSRTLDKVLTLIEEIDETIDFLKSDDIGKNDTASALSKLNRHNRTLRGLYLRHPYVRRHYLYEYGIESADHFDEFNEALMGSFQALRYVPGDKAGARREYRR